MPWLASFLPHIILSFSTFPFHYTDSLFLLKWYRYLSEELGFLFFPVLNSVKTFHAFSDAFQVVIIFLMECSFLAVISLE